MTRAPHGFSLVELLVAMAVMVTVTGALMSLVLAGESIARAQPEAADLQQRARVALQTLGAELALAGAGLDQGPQAGALAQFFPPIAPSIDGGVTLWYVSSREAQATLGAALAPGETDAAIQNAGNCPASDPACAFTQGTTAIVFDTQGCRDVLRIDAVTSASLRLHALPRGCQYRPGAAIAQAEVRTYRVDAVTRQLLRRDEATGTSLPVLDNVASMSVEYFDAARRVRVTLRFSPATPMPAVPDLVIAYDVMPPNLQGR